MIYRSITEEIAASGNYRTSLTVDTVNGKFERAYITAFADLPASCRMDEYGEDYHDADEIFVWGKYETTSDRMGWSSPEKMINNLNSRGVTCFTPLA